MRLALMIAALMLVGLPLRAQEEEGEVKDDPSAHDGMDHQGDAGAPMVRYEARDADIAGDWGKIRKHWELARSASGPEKAKHLRMHREMLGGFMDGLSKHAAEDAPSGGAREDEVGGMRSKHEDLRRHWKVVQGVEDTEPLETHLAMHMRMLEDLYRKGEKAGVHPERGDGEGRGEGEENDGESSRRPAGY